ncbi:MAG TPA: type II toxin-antitoxin system RelE/ParE family toxin [Pseudolabrys sp.]|nr:type II toxin-antitoxin system RelE/ParE family toxin [Pseudolabrys sp.]
MKVRFSPSATDDIIQIADYLIERRPAAARAVETAIRNSIGLLAEFPGSGRGMIERPGVRIMPIVRYPYLIYYEIGQNELVVLRILHGARAPLSPDTL